MEEIEVGDYVRTDKGVITRYSDKEKTFLKRMNEGKSIFGKTIKHSKNILDLIEVGDYVNGYKILEIYEALAPDDERILDIGYGMAIFNDSIKSIVTKEQFASIEYRLEEKWKKI